MASVRSSGVRCAMRTRKGLRCIEGEDGIRGEGRGALFKHRTNPPSLEGNSSSRNEHARHRRA